MRSSITGQSSNAINFQQPSNTVSGSHDNRQNAPAQQETQPVQTPAYAQNQSSKNASSLRKKFMSSEAYKSEQTNKLIREAKNGNIERAQHYIAKGADLTHAVHKAINDVDALAGLLSVGGDPNCMHKGLTPADRADRAKNAPALAVLRSDPRFDPQRIVDSHLRTIMQQSVWSHSRANSHPTGHAEWHDPDSVDPLSVPGR